MVEGGKQRTFTEPIIRTNVSYVRFCDVATLHLVELELMYVYLSSQCCAYALVRSMHKNNFVKVRKTLWFGLKDLFWLPQSGMEMA